MIKYIIGLAMVVGLAIAAWLYTLYDEIKQDIDVVINYTLNQTAQS